MPKYPETSDFASAKKVLLSNPAVRLLVENPNIKECPSEKLLRLMGILTFICLNGSWDKYGIAEVSGEQFLRISEKCIISLKDCPYGDIYRRLP